MPRQLGAGQKSGSETMFTSHALFCQGSGSALMYIRKMYLDQKIAIYIKILNHFPFLWVFFALLDPDPQF
jgi:hypothetical protein